MPFSHCRVVARLVQTSIVIASYAIFASSCNGQTAPASDPNVDNGTHWYGSYDGVHENISLSSGNLSFCIPLVSLKGPNKHDLNIPLCYNSQFQEAYTNQGLFNGQGNVLSYYPWVWPNTPSGSATPPLGPGWALSGAPAYYGAPATSANGSPVLFMPDGAKYTLPSSNAQGGLVPGPDAQSADIWYNANGTTTMKDGTRWVTSTPQGGSGSCPPVGCTTEYFTDSASAITYTNSSVTDLVGRTVNYGAVSTSSTVNVAFQYPDSSGTTRTVTVQMATMQFTCTNVPGPNQNNPYDEMGGGAAYNAQGQLITTSYSMPTAIILPNGLTYTMQYDQCGMLRKITYPSGGYTRYDYTAQQQGFCPVGYDLPCGITENDFVNQISAKHVCAATALTLGSTSASSFTASNQCSVAEQTTTYAPIPYTQAIGNGNSQNTVTDPIGNYVVYQFSQPMTTMTPAIPALETSRQYYDASGKLWKTVTTQYSTTAAPGSVYHTGALGSSTTTSQPTTSAAPLPTIQTTTLDDGMVSQVQWSYDLYSPFWNDSVLIEKREYDYSSGAPGPLLRKTDYDWLHRDNPAAYGWPMGVAANHICDRKTSEIVYDGSGKTISNATYVYDTNNGGGPGLLTSVKKWRSTDGATLTTSYTYAAFGNVASKTDPNGNVTQYSYTDNYSDGVNRSSNAFLTQTTNALSQTTRNQYYWGSGLVAASCGENFTGSCTTGGNSGADYASYTYDMMSRQTSVTTGDGGQSTNCFSELGGTGCSQSGSYPLQVTSTELIASGVMKSSTATLDGLARTTRSQLNTDPSCAGGTVNVDTVFDVDGRKSTVTNPYCSGNTGAPTSGTTTYTYDGLSRVTQITHPDGTFATNQYTGRAVMSSDEGNGSGAVQRISQSDGIGRLISVCEVMTGTQQGNTNNSPNACNLDYAGTGFLTTYGYDASNSTGPLESLTTVTQGGVARSFIYDSLGELKAATNPESGTTTYNYDNDSNLTSKTDANSKTITYVYDHLNRLLSKTYSDGTASACYQYDQTSVTHGVGRLTSEWTQAGTCASTAPSSGALTERTFAAYDLMGRVATDEQCKTPGNCSTMNTVQYAYTPSGGVSTFTNGLSGSQLMTFTNSYNSADRLSEVVDQANTNLFTATGYSPAGALSNALIGPGITFQRSYNSRLLPISENDTVATTPGDASVDIDGAEQLSGYSTGTITFAGTEQCSGGTCDGGLFLIEIGNTTPIQINYGSSSTPQSLASTLASVISCSNNGVQAAANAAVVTLVSCAAGTNVDHTIQAIADGHNWSFPQYSFTATTSGAAMTPVLTASNLGGTPAIPAYNNPYATSITFSGTESGGQTGAYQIAVYPNSVGGGPPALLPQVGWNSSSTPTSLASSLVSQFSACSVHGTSVSATQSGATVTLVSCTGSTYAISSSLDTYSNGSGPDFTALTNGSTAAIPAVPGPFNVPAPTYDSGTVALTVNGTQIASVSFSSTSTPATVAAALVSAASSNTLATVAQSATKSNELQMTAIGSGTHTNYSYAVTVSYNTSLFSVASFSGSPSSGSFVGGSGVPLYNWAISSYAPNGDVLQMTDSVMGSWTYTYDAMNRLTSGTATGGADDGLTLSWAYDRYGNRWSQTASGTGSATAVQPQLTFNGSNGVNTNRIDGWSYDAAGNLLNDKIHTYTYDAENRIATIGGSPAYIYDAEGRRVAKTNSSGAPTIVYILGLGGEQVTELNSSGAWVHSNVFAGGGRLLASYEGPAGTDTAGYHYHLTDWLGTKRMQTTASGNQEQTCMSYPFGDGLSCTGGPDSTEHHFTGKERDPESGLDYFGARYMTSDLGRFMTPDWAAKPTDVPYAKFGDPQTLNLYAYLNDDPLSRIDVDGHGELWDKFVAIFFAKVDVGVGAKAEINLGKNVKFGAEAFAGGERKFTSSGSTTSLKAEAGAGLHVGPACACVSRGIEKQIATDGKPDVKPAEVTKVDPHIGGEAEAVGASGQASLNELSVTLALPGDVGVTGGGTVGMDLDKAGDYLSALGQTLSGGMDSVSNLLMPSPSGNSSPSGMPVPTPAPQNQNQ